MHFKDWQAGRQWISAFTCIVLLALTCGCGGSAETGNNNKSTESIMQTTAKDEQENKAVQGQIIKDTQFEGPIGIMGRSQKVQVSTSSVTLGQKEVKAKSFWRLGQWNSKYNIATAELTRTSEGYVLKNEGKLLAKLQGEGGSQILRLGVNGSKEFKTGARKEGQSWPHLLLEQSIESTKPISEYERIDFSLDVRINKSQNLMGEDYKPELHCAQATAYFIVSNKNKDSAGYGDYIWFGIPIFDSRYEYPPFSSSQDKGAVNTTGKFIYVLDGKTVLHQNLMDGKWDSISLDIAPAIKAAYEKAKSVEYLPNSEYGDLQLAAFNIGWEVTGSFDCELDMKNLRCIGN